MGLVDGELGEAILTHDMVHRFEAKAMEFPRRGVQRLDLMLGENVGRVFAPIDGVAGPAHTFLVDRVKVEADAFQLPRPLRPGDLRNSKH